jgi:uncharacterized membrane protein
MASENGVLLDCVLRPSPPLRPPILFAIVTLVALIDFVIAHYFVAQGAWPIVPFLGANVVLLAWAFRASLIAARREEHVMLTASLLCIARRTPDGSADAVKFNPYWVQVQMDEPAEHWSQLMLWSHGRGLRIGAFLAPDERAAFTQILKTALRQARETTL